MECCHRPTSLYVCLYWCYTTKFELVFDALAFRVVGFTKRRMAKVKQGTHIQKAYTSTQWELQPLTRNTFDYTQSHQLLLIMRSLSWYTQLDLHTYIHNMTLFKIAPMFLSLVVSDDIMLIHTHFDDSQSLQQWTLNESIITKTGDQVVVQNPERKIFSTSFLNIQCH